MGSWTFLTNHAQVLISIADDPGQTTREMALRLGLTERAVQRIVADLEAAGYVSKRKEGRRNRYQVFTDQPFRHPAQKGIPIGALLALVQNNTEAGDSTASAE